MSRSSWCCALAVVLSSCTGEGDPPVDSDESGDSADSGDPAAGSIPEQLASRGACPEVTGAGLEHGGTVAQDEVWTPDDNPHRVTSQLWISATVELQPCTQVVIDPGVSIEVGGTDGPGRLVARGGVADDSVRPVNLQAADPAQPWGRLYVAAGGELELSLVALQDGGATTTGDAGALVVAGVAAGTNAGQPVASTTIDRVLIERARSHGLNLAAWGALRSGSTGLWIRECGGAGAESAVRLEAGVAGTLPADTVIEGNLRDEILVTSSKTFIRDDRFLDLGVPYRVQGALRVAPAEDGAPVTLELDAGVTLAFEPTVDSGMIVGTSDARAGILVAHGRADAPIVFTSALPEPAPGDWMGVVFAYTPQSGSRIEFGQFEYAGGESGHDSYGCGPKDNDAAIIVHGQGPDLAPPDPVVFETQFDHIGGETVIVSGWTDDSGPNLGEGNTFGADTPACKVSRPRRSGAGDNCDGGRTECWGS